MLNEIQKRSNLPYRKKYGIMNFDYLSESTEKECDKTKTVLGDQKYIGDDTYKSFQDMVYKNLHRFSKNTMQEIFGEKPKYVIELK